MNAFIHNRVDNRVISTVWCPWLATLDVLVWSVVPSVHLTTRRVRSDLIETFKIIHEINKVDKNLFFEFDSGGTRWGLVGYLVIPYITVSILS